LLAYSGCPGKEAVKQMSGFDVEFKLISVLKLNQCDFTMDQSKNWVDADSTLQCLNMKNTCN